MTLTLKNVARLFGSDCIAARYVSSKTLLLRSMVELSMSGIPCADSVSLSLSLSLSVSVPVCCVVFPVPFSYSTQASFIVADDVIHAEMPLTDDRLIVAPRAHHQVCSGVDIDVLCTRSTEVIR